MNIFDNLSLHVLMTLAGLLSFGVYWRKSKWPNRYFYYVLPMLGMIVYPTIELCISDEPSKQFRHPLPVLIIIGAGLAIATVALQPMIVGLLKKMGIEFPEGSFPTDPGQSQVGLLPKEIDKQPPAGPTSTT